ncbi:MAG: energy transducer TonB [Proteobacteria bacterium]|nr:energy transducer TonB [Pseudomonadota bacterium]
MTQSGQPAAQDEQRVDGLVRKDLYYPALTVAIALAFVANAWFFYRQGQQDTAKVDPANLPAATIAWTIPVPPQSAASANPPDGSTASESAPQPVATSNDTAKPANGDGANADKPAVRRAPRPKPATRMLAKSPAPAAPVAKKPVDRGVALLSHPKPAYPAPALRGREQGTVLVLAQVDSTGRVSDAHVVRHSGSYTLDRAAASEVRRWKFEPALRNGQPVVASVQVPVSYRLGD